MNKEFKKNIFLNKGYEKFIDWELFASDINGYLDTSCVIKDEKYVKAGICTLDAKKLFIKKYVNRGYAFRIKNLLGLSKAKKNCKISNSLLNSSVNFPKAYGYIANGNVLTGGDIFLILEAVDNIASNHFYKDVIYADKKNLSEYIKKVVLQISWLHRQNIIHNDCKRSNFYLSGTINSYKVGILDFDGAKSYVKITNRQRARDLSRFIAAVIEDFSKVEFISHFKNDELVNYIVNIYSTGSDNNSLALKGAINNKLCYHLKRKGL